MNFFIQELQEEAKKRMQKSGDHIHDLAHAARVAAYSEHIGRGLKLSDESLEILSLASWWHDTGRTLTRKPSIVWMRCVDDFVSAFLLWRKAKKLHVEHDNIVSVAIRIILSHNFGTERLLSKIILTPKYRELLSIIADADTLDTLHITRINELRNMVENSRIYKQGYKITIWWFLHTRELEFKTEWAQKYFAEEVLETFLKWFTNTEIFEWHSQMFSLAWVEKTIAQGEIFLQSFQTSTHVHS